MSDLVVEFLRTINVTQFIALGIMIWFFYSRLDKKIEKLEKKMDENVVNLEAKFDNKFSKLNDRIDKLDDKLSEKVADLGRKVEDLDRRLCRIEGSLATHGHCLFNQSHNEKKAG